MKNFLIFVMLLVGLAVASCSSPPDKVVYKATQSEFVQVADLQVSAPVMYVQDAANLPAPDNPAEKKSNFFLSNWAELVLGFFGFLKILVNLTPTTKDNQIFGLLDTFINMIIPNLKKGGGKFT